MLLEIKNLSFQYTEDKILFHNFNLNIGKGSIVALAGESGCGKSTLLSLIYGLIDWQDGEIIFDGNKTMGPKGNIVPGENEMKFVAQNYDLMPYATVYDNVGKFLSNINLQQKRDRVLKLLEITGMESYIDEFPKNLSGGQQQRVAISRALSVAPKLLLLDEPFSNLDFPRKIELRERLFSYLKENGITLIISTHEIQEIMPWLDDIAILRDGQLIQNAPIQEVYHNPNDDYVAKLFGEVNIFSEDEKQVFKIEKKIWYPAEIRLCNDGIIAKVTESRFAGSYYWNKVLVGNKSLTIYSECWLHGNVNLKFISTQDSF